MIATAGSVAFRERELLRLLERLQHAEPHELVAVGGPEARAEARAAEARGVAEGPAAPRAVLVAARPRLGVGRVVRVLLLVVDVEAPLPDVPRHVERAVRRDA